MNSKQVKALADLMFSVKPPKKMYDTDADPWPELHVALEVVHGYDDGNTYEARLWTTATGYRFPDRFYLRGDGTVYVYDSEKDESHAVKKVEWDWSEGGSPTWRMTLRSTVEEPVLADMEVR